ncbi:hypothetical protein QBC42DRAFT_272636 [Cladorrhinum samala]|uniref:Transmembrane protein n=1 Tax=Cladorrhinum samala TaxID=585594 RepID=A0AAV9HK92_9PEZI|nr:hypothetical protein QBC42DRAFT_272636 [Cladorrhinum samala]
MFEERNQQVLELRNKAHKHTTPWSRSNIFFFFPLPYTFSFTFFYFGIPLATGCWGMGTGIRKHLHLAVFKGKHSNGKEWESYLFWGREAIVFLPVTFLGGFIRGVFIAC